MQIGWPPQDTETATLHGPGVATDTWQFTSREGEVEVHTNQAFTGMFASGKTLPSTAGLQPLSVDNGSWGHMAHCGGVIMGWTERVQALGAPL